MQKIAKDVYQLDGFPEHMVNIYLIGDVLVDAGIRQDERRIARQLKGHTVNTHVLTHAHPDHQGASRAVCEGLNIPLWMGATDADAMTRGDIQSRIPENWITNLQMRYWTGPAYPVDRALQEGDEVAGFTVIDTPGHSPGQIALWREQDGVLIAGDVLNNMNMLTTQTGLHEPPAVFTLDAVQNRASAHKLAALRPSIVCFGHGRPLMDGAQFVDFVAQLPLDETHSQR